MRNRNPAAGQPSGRAALARGPGKSRVIAAFDLYTGNNAFRFLLNFSLLGWLTLLCLQLSGGLGAGPSPFDLQLAPGADHAGASAHAATSTPPAAQPLAEAHAEAPAAAGGAPASAPAAPASRQALLAQVLGSAAAGTPAQPRYADLQAASGDALARARAQSPEAVSAYLQGEAAVRSGAVDRIETGLVLLSRAANEGMPAAMTAYGLARLAPPASLPADTALGRQWLQRAADAGEAQAAVLLARANLSGAAGFTDRDKAETLLRRAADLGDRHAALSLAALRAGDGGAEALAEAEQQLRVSADKGELAAQAALGRYLALSAKASGGRYDEAVLWLERAASHGDISAMETLGDIRLYLAKSAPMQDPAKGVAWYERCAAAGRAACDVALGRSYRLALGTAADLPRSWAHLARARTLGAPAAQAELQLVEQAMTPTQRVAALRLLGSLK